MARLFTGLSQGGGRYRWLAFRAEVVKRVFPVLGSPLKFTEDVQSVGVERAFEGQRSSVRPTVGLVQAALVIVCVVGYAGFYLRRATSD